MCIYKMQLLSVIGVKIGRGQRAAIVQSSDSLRKRRIHRFLNKLSRTTLLLVLIFGGIFLQIREYQPVLEMQSRITDSLAPLTEIIIAPTRWISELISSTQIYLKNKQDVVEENLSLKLQNDFLIRQKNSLEQSVVENEKLREALSVQSTITDNMLTVQISHHTHDGYSQTFYAKISDQTSVSKNDVILTTKGFLTGRVVRVYQESMGASNKNLMRIMPITDPASRVPVKVEESGEQAILSGRGQNPMELTHIENLSQFKVGQKLVTSGIGGIFPAGLPVAQIIKINSSIYALPLGKLEDQEFALVLIK